MILTIFIILMFILALMDYFYHDIPNFIVLPTILLGVFLTKNWKPILITDWLPVLAVGCISALFYYHETICPHCGKVAEVTKLPLSSFGNAIAGGDIKLMAMVVAFLGWLAFPIFGATWALIKLFRLVRDNYQPLPVAPFMFLVTIGTIGLLQLCRMTTP